MEKDPRRLLEIKGISPKKCEDIANEVQKIFNLRHLMIFLSQYGIKAGYAMKAYQQWGLQAIELVKSNPYCLCGYPINMPFKKAEEAAKEMNIPSDSHKRLRRDIHIYLKKTLRPGIHVFR